MEIAQRTLWTNARVFTGKHWIENGAVAVENGRITAIGELAITADATIIDCKGNMLLPAFLDLQVYGAGGKLLAAYPEEASLEILAAENRKQGVASCLACIATQPPDVIYASIDAVKKYLAKGGQGILGLHLEGPFINPIRKGAHPAAFIHSPDIKQVEALLVFAEGAIKMVTLAPEVCDANVIGLFKEAGVIIAAGHSNASYEQAMQFPQQDIHCITHLFNAMSPLHHRDTGIPGAAFENPQLKASIIPDGIHVSYSALRIAKSQMQERLYFITDSVTETSIGAYPHRLNNDRYCMPDGTLSGSAISMLQGVKNAVAHAGIHLDEALRMASLYPAQVMGIENDYGQIAVGNKASMILLNDKLELAEDAGVFS